MARPLPPPEECANCGTDIPRNAHACPECGADERTGWRETSIYDGLDLPDESDGQTERKPVRVFWILVGVGLLALLILATLGLNP
ncbi:MAG: zinc ribbon domain-containing protein [Rariglobus sp.]